MFPTSFSAARSSVLVSASARMAPARLSLLAAALATALPALAQQAPTLAADTAVPLKKAAPPAAGKDADMQKVEIKGSADTYDARRDDTASKIVVNHEEIVKFGDTNALDVLKRLPGVTVSGTGRGGEVRMRGLGAGYTQILVNGERAPAGFSMDSLAPDVIERIEVLRAASAEYSTQSIAGTINIVLKKAVKTGLREVKIGMGAARDSKTPTLNLQLSDRQGQLSYSVSANAVSSAFERDTTALEEGDAFLDGVADGVPGRATMRRSSAQHEDGRFTAVNIAPRLNWTFTGGDTLTWQSFINASRFKRQSEQTTSTTLGAPPPYSFVDWGLGNQAQFLRTELNWVTKLGGGAKLDTKISAGYGTGKNDSRRLGYIAPGAMRILDNRVTSDVTDQPYTTTGKYATPIMEGHALAMGWDGGFSKRDDTRIQRELPIPGYGAINSDEHFIGKVSRLAAYAQDEWNVTPRWSVYVGLRWEGIKTDISGTGFDAATSTSRVWSPLFQTLYKLPDAKGDQIRFAVTRTYKAPPTDSLVPRRFTTANNSVTEPDSIGNPNLKPELALGFDTSYEHYWAEGALFSISASVRRISDYTRTGLFLGSDGRWAQTPVNDGKASTRGLEMEAKFPLKAVMQTTLPLDLRASISRNWSKVDSAPGPNNRLNQQTPFSATVGGDYKRGPLTAGASYAFKNGGLVRQSATQSSYATVRRELEMYGLWKFDPKNQLRVSLSNILAQDAISDNTVSDRFGTVRRRNTTPGEVMLRATMEIKF